MASGDDERSLTDCHFFMTSGCTKGAACPFRHCEQAKATVTACPGWQPGTCNSVTCPMRHPVRSAAHSLPSVLGAVLIAPLLGVVEQAVPVCMYFLQGNCTRGAACYFRHVATPPAAAGAAVAVAAAAAAPADAAVQAQREQLKQRLQEQLEEERRKLSDRLKQQQRAISGRGLLAIPTAPVLLQPQQQGRKRPLSPAVAEPDDHAKNGALKRQRASIDTAGIPDQRSLQEKRRARFGSASNDSPSSSTPPRRQPSSSAPKEEGRAPMRFVKSLDEIMMEKGEQPIPSQSPARSAQKPEPQPEQAFEPDQPEQQQQLEADLAPSEEVGEAEAYVDDQNLVSDEPPAEEAAADDAGMEEGNTAAVVEEAPADPDGLDILPAEDVENIDV
eukprot:m51a1_g13875 putative zinc finger ccch domain-containing protein 17-like (388) ;mRNA; f:638601-640096